MDVVGMPCFYGWMWICDVDEDLDEDLDLDGRPHPDPGVAISRVVVTTRDDCPCVRGDFPESRCVVLRRA